MKKTLVLAAAVIGVHCVAISGLFLVQGCKTTKGTTSASPSPTMPPLSAPAAAPATIEPAPIISEKDTKSEGTIEYTVVKGDSLGLIAKKHNTSKAELMELNKLTDPNKIRVGQKLIIPKRAHAAAYPAAKHADAKAKDKAKDKAKSEDKAPAATLATGINEYVVQAGDSLSKISAKLNVKISELREVNKLVNDKLKIGQKLTVPAKKTEGAPESPAPAVTPAPAPAASEPAAQATPAAAPTPAPGTPAVVPAETPAKGISSGITHTVLANEDINTIAKLYVVSADDVAAANQMGTNRTVHAGQKIIIPQP